MESKNFVICRTGRELREEDAQRVNALADEECERIVNQRTGTPAPQAVIRQHPEVHAVPKKQHGLRQALHRAHKAGALMAVFGSCCTAALLLGAAGFFPAAFTALSCAAADVLLMAAAI